MKEKPNFYDLKHDINGLIFKIETALDLVEDELDNNFTEVLDICKNSLRNLKTLLDLILSIEKLSQGKYNLKIEKINSTEICGISEKVSIKPKEVFIDINLFKLIIEILDKLPESRLIINHKKAVLLIKQPSSKIEKFYIECIIFILKLFDFDTEVYIDDKKKKNFDNR